MSRVIYKIINTHNGKFYVGSAVRFERRKAQHLWKLRRGDHSNKHLQAAWDKYGEAAFVFAVVEEIPDGEDLLAAENVWLKEHVGKEYCYNISIDATAFGTGWTGEKNPMWGRTFKHTEDAKARIGEAAAKRIQSDEEKAKRIATMQGHHVATPTREKISAKLSGEGNFWYGKKRPDHSEKVSRPVLVTDKCGITTEYKSIQDLRLALGLKPPTVNRALKAGKPLTKGPFTGYSFKYLS